MPSSLTILPGIVSSRPFYVKDSWTLKSLPWWPVVEDDLSGIAPRYRLSVILLYQSRSPFLYLFMLNFGRLSHNIDNFRLASKWFILPNLNAESLHLPIVSRENSVFSSMVKSIFYGRQLASKVQGKTSLKVKNFFIRIVYRGKGYRRIWREILDFGQWLMKKLWTENVKKKSEWVKISRQKSQVKNGILRGVGAKCEYINCMRRNISDFFNFLKKNL